MITYMRKFHSIGAARFFYGEKRRQGYNTGALPVKGEWAIFWSPGFISNRIKKVS